MKKTFATAINCIDGRVQLPLYNWVINTYQVDYVDMITEPGPDRMIVHGSPERIAAIKEKVTISVTVRPSRIVVIIGHHDCVANPVSEAKHIELIHKGIEVIHGWKLPAMVIGAWINENWDVEIIKED